jgi:hypothetical protein
VQMDGERRVACTDESAPEATRIGYRLVFASGSGPARGGEVWVDTPSRTPFGIRSIGPNPAVDHAVVALGLTESRGARLDVIDLAGRRVLTRELGTLQPGERRVNVNGLGNLSPGLYMVRLSAGAKVATSRLMVMR